MSLKNRLLLIMVVGVCVAFALGFALGLSATPAEACECCPEPVVKVEWDGRLWTYDTDMNDRSILVTGNERVMCYEVVSGTAITEIRTKAGQDIECIYPQGEEQTVGCIEAEDHDLSSVWFCNDGPTAVELSSFTAEPIPVRDWIGPFRVGMLIGLVCVVLALREESRR